MQTIRKLFGVSFVTSIGFLILGLFLVFRTEGTINLIASLIGFILLMNGGISLLKYFRNTENRSYSVELIYGIVAIIAGFILILNPSAVVSIFPFVLGVYFLATGIMKIKYALDIRSYGKSNPIFMFILAILTVIFGIVFIVNPFGGAVAITQIIGVFLIVYSCLDIINYLCLRKDMKTIEKILE